MAYDDCGEMIQALGTFLDGELSDETRSKIRAHLVECVDCLQAFDFEAELKAAIRRKCSNDAIPPGLLAKIERCLDTGVDGGGIIADPA